jgi:hypothetical protein
VRYEIGIFVTIHNIYVIVFCDHEFFRPVGDDMLVENDGINFPRPVGMQCW